MIEFAKWGSGLWRDILTARYGSLFIPSYRGGRISSFYSSSSWWKEIFLLRTKEDRNFVWFSDVIDRKVGSGLHTSF